MESLFSRSSGLLLHITSLPARLTGEIKSEPGIDGTWSLGDIGSGDLGPAAYDYVRFLHRAKQRWWQILPTGPVGYGYSPYQSPSSFAGNPLMVSPALLVRDGLLRQEDWESVATIPSAQDPSKVDFGKSSGKRFELLRMAFRRFQHQRSDLHSQLDEFRHQQSDWLDEHCLFTACKNYYDEKPWNEWESALIRREPNALGQWFDKLRIACDFEAFIQWLFERQWQELRQYAASLGVGIIGDIPIFVSMDSSDVWSRQQLFELDEQGQPLFVAGVPPDYFSESGQRWGNPLYRWDAHKATGYEWWIRRFKRMLQLCDLIRIDHFRGFEAYWEIPASRTDARVGNWRPGPCEQFFDAIAQSLGKKRGEELPVIAEDLGFITAEVHALRDAFHFPGMRIVQFGFGSGEASSLDLPHNYPNHCISYTGTHDNDTVVGWYQSVAGEGSTRTQREIDIEKQFALKYLACRPEEIHMGMMRSIWSSVSAVTIAPVQDLLGLPGSARMNMPGTIDNNWIWRCLPGLLNDPCANWLGDFSETYARSVSK